MTTQREAAAAVVRAYETRARFARAETAAVHRPRLLRGLLDSVGHVAEIPCGTGHFLGDYARAGVAVTLVDANSAMLALAVEHAVEAGLPADRTFPTVAYLQALDLPTEVDAVVVPNGALNQMARQSPLADLLAALRRGMRSGAELLAQVACTHPDGVDAATFYDANLPHQVWFTDRRFDPRQAAGAVLRRRRQHRDGDQVRIEFDYRDATNTSLHTTTVQLTLFFAQSLTDALTAAGFTHVRFLAGPSGLSEVLAAADAGARR